jgi:hypothetical protein
LVSADYGALLMLEGATGMRYDGVVYREVCDDDGPTRLNFMAYWREANGNPTTLGPFLAMLRERYPDLSVEPGGARRMNHDSPRGNPLPIPPFRDPLSNGNIRTFESRDAWQTLGRLALNFHRRKEWTFAAIGASLSPCRDKGRLAHPGSCPAGDGATAGPRR